MKNVFIIALVSLFFVGCAPRITFHTAGKTKTIKVKREIVLDGNCLEFTTRSGLTQHVEADLINIMAEKDPIVKQRLMEAYISRHQKANKQKESVTIVAANNDLNEK